ncbi:MAG: hypothetical protein ACKVP7_11215 [Hyphomicrobiaceae bacterium]
MALVLLALAYGASTAAVAGQKSKRKAVTPLEVVCVAGCNTPAPEVVYRAKPGQPVGPPVRTETGQTEVIRGVWCSRRDGCSAVGTLPPTEWQRGASHSLAVHVWHH